MKRALSALLFLCALPFSAYDNTAAADVTLPADAAGAELRPFSPAGPLSTNYGLPGTLISINSPGFRPGEPIYLTFDYDFVRWSTADRLGNLVDSFTVPSRSRGWYQFRAWGYYSGSVLTEYFDVDSTAPMCMNGPSGAPPAAPMSCNQCHIQSYACFIAGTWTCCDSGTCNEVYGGPGSGCNGR